MRHPKSHSALIFLEPGRLSTVDPELQIDGPVSRNADGLGVDYDRLQRTCKRETGRNPGELVHERLMADAKARLEHTGAPLRMIAADLGFPDATRFSHFFKRRTDMTTGACRAIVSRPDGEDLAELRPRFPDGP